MPDRLLHLGRFGRPRGVKGAITADWFGERLPVAGMTVFSSGAGQPRPYLLRAVQRHNGRLILGLDGIDDRNKASMLTGQEIFLPREALGPLAENEFFLADLPGCLVFLEDGSLLGALDHIEYPAGLEVWSIKAEKQPEILFPARPEFIVSIDPVRKKIVIAPPDGLLDIYRA